MMTTYMRKFAPLLMTAAVVAAVAGGCVGIAILAGAYANAVNAPVAYCAGGYGSSCPSIGPAVGAY
jgi:hypothetical protein